MHYVTHRALRMQKYMFSLMTPSALFMETTQDPPEHVKSCVNVLCPGRIGMHYMTHRSYQMQKRKFSITCPSTLFMETTLSPPEHGK
jgi:hypothetical protein